MNTSHQRHELDSEGSGNAPQGGDEVLGSLSGGKNAPMMGQEKTPVPPSAPSTPPASTEDPMGGLLGSILGGAGGAQGGAQPGGDLGGLLGSILGGAEGSGAQGGTAAGGGLGGLLGSILGGGGTNASAQGGNDPLGGLLGGLFGGSGGQANMGAMGNASGLTSMLEPYADKLADKLGIPRETAMAVLTVVAPMVINKLMSSGQQGSSGSLGTSMQREGLSFTPDEKHEMAKQIASQTGLDHHSATNTLNQAIQVLSSQ